MTTAFVQMGGQVLAATRPALLDGGCLNRHLTENLPTPIKKAQRWGVGEKVFGVADRGRFWKRY